MTTVGTDTLLAGRYRLGALLGSGGMADVYDAVDERLDRPVAVKVLRPAMAAQPDVRRRFEAEARAAARLSHPNVVAVFDTGVDGTTPWLVMERLPGETLADRIRGGALDAEWVRRLAGDVLGALAAAHAAGIVHRDIKPGNILIGADGCAKVADFGIAKSLEVADDDTHTVSGQLIGTPAYVAPERIDGEPATVRSDLYALGVVLYEALGGRRPFGGTTPMSIAYAVRHGDVEPLSSLRPDLPAPLLAAVERAMARDPARRFASAADMARTLRSGLSASSTPAAPVDDEPTVVLSALVPESRHERARDRRWAPWAAGSGAGRSWAPLALIAAAALGALVLAGLWLTSAAGPSAAEQLASDLRETASELSAPVDGPRAGEAASRLEALASAVQQDDGPARAQAASAGNALLGDLANWQALGELGPPTVDRLRKLVLRVPGTHESSFVATTTTTSAVPAALDAGDDDEGEGRGKGNKKKREDD
jgi:hypothetical protein